EAITARDAEVATWLPALLEAAIPALAVAADVPATADDIPDVPETPVAAAGDCWLLGPHRVVCGDATDAATVARLLAGADVACCLTGPPYSVAYDRSRASRGGSRRAHAPYVDGARPEDVLAFLAHVPGPSLVMSFPVDRHLAALTTAIAAAGWELRKELV